MSKLTDPDALSVAVNTTAAGTDEVEIQTGSKTIKLLPQGTLDDLSPGKSSGVTAKAFYSFLKEEWLNGADSAILRRFKFPLKMIFEGSFIWVNGWSPLDDQTRDLVRDAGFQEGVTSDEYSCLVSLGSIDDPAADQAYYTQVAGFTQTTIPYDKTGELNENVRVLDFGVNDFRSYLKSYLREQGKLYSEYNLLSEQGLSTLAFQAYAFPLSNGTDLKVTNSDVTLDSAVEPFQSMRIDYLKGSGFTTFANTTLYPASAVVFDGATSRWFFTSLGGTSNNTTVATDTGVTDWVAYYGEELIGSTYYAFNRVVTCANATDRQAYDWLMRQLRKTTNINDDNVAITAGQGAFGVVNGEVGALLAEYVGDTLKPAGGVVLRGFDTNSTNVITHRPISVDTNGLDSEFVPLVTSEVTFPFVAAGNFNFSSNLDNEVDDNDTFYTVYFEYITRTSGSYTLTLVTTDTGNLTWAGADLDHIIATDYIYLTGFTVNTGNNGLYLVNSVGAGTMNITHQTGITLVTETATVQVDENPFESPGAVIVNDNAGPSPMSGTISALIIGWDFDYTNNNQGGRTPNTPAPIRIVAQSLNTAEWIDATHTITAATGQNIAINSSDERNYSNIA